MGAGEKERERVVVVVERRGGEKGWKKKLWEESFGFEEREREKTNKNKNQQQHRRECE